MAVKEFRNIIYKSIRGAKPCASSCNRPTFIDLKTEVQDTRSIQDNFINPMQQKSQTAPFFFFFLFFFFFYTFKFTLSERFIW